MLPQVADTARIAACQPKAARLLIICSLEPIERPKMNRSSRMVHEILFSVCCKKDIFLKRYPIVTPVSMVPTIENIIFLWGLT